jgi:hypothetical protein
VSRCLRGTIYNVTDYWRENDQLHFMTLDASGTKWVGHTAPIHTLDLQKTEEVSRERGFHFMLREEPMQQYLLHHPEIGAASQPASISPPQP